MDLAYLVQTPGAERMASAIKEAHAQAWNDFFLALGFPTGAPLTVQQNIQVNIDTIWRKEPDLWVDNHTDYQDLPPESKPINGYLL